MYTTKIMIEENELENVVCSMVFILSRTQSFKL